MRAALFVSTAGQRATPAARAAGADAPMKPAGTIVTLLRFAIAPCFAIAPFLCGILASGQSGIALASAFAVASAPVAAQTVVRIGHVAPMTGGIARLGKDNDLGAKLAVEELNAKKITIGGKQVSFELLSEDDAADPKQGTAAAQKLVDAAVVGVVGHLNSGTSIPASRIYSEAGIPQVSPSSTAPKYTRQGFKTTFRVVASSTTAPRMARAWPTSSGSRRRQGRVRRSRRGRRGQGRGHGGVQEALRGEARRRGATVCALRLRRGQRARGGDADGRLDRPEENTCRSWRRSGTTA